MNDDRPLCHFPKQTPWGRIVMSVAIARGWRRLYFERKYIAFCNTLVAAERDSLRARLAAAEKECDELRAENAALNHENVRIAGEHGKYVAGKMSAENYIEMTLMPKVSSGIKKITLTIQRCDGKTPHEKRMEAEAESKRLREALIDYGNHYETCPHYGKIRQQDVEGVKCTCGFTAALRDSETKEKI